MPLPTSSTRDPASPSPCSAPPFSRSRAPRQCTRIWAISAGCPFNSDGSRSCCPLLCSTISAREDCCWRTLTPSIISGAYSLTQQAMQLGFLPRMRVQHTASHEKGQIYVPIVNWLLAAGTLAAVLICGSSDALGGAYGIAVSMLMAITTVLAALVALKWGYNPLMVAAVNGFFLVIELIFVAANMTKLIQGGWFPLLMDGVIGFLMLTWRTGWQLLEHQRSKLRQREDEFVAWVLNSPPIRLSGGAGVFQGGGAGGRPARGL